MRSPLLFFLLAAVSNGAEFRIWTDVQDRKVDASLVRVDSDSVILKLRDGREVPYPLAKLSAADGKFVREMPGTKAPEEQADTSPNFDSPWPDLIRFTDDPEINTVEEDAEKHRFIYESANYRYTCDVRLAKSVVKGFAVMFEATHLYCHTLPLAIDGGEKTDGKFQILLFEKFEDYAKADDPASSAGVYMSEKKAVLVPLQSLGVKPVGSGYMLDREKSSNTIPHELTHQLSPECYFESGAMGWFTEGLAARGIRGEYALSGWNLHGSGQREDHPGIRHRIRQEGQGRTRVGHGHQHAWVQDLHVGGLCLLPTATPAWLRLRAADGHLFPPHGWRR